MIYDIQKGVSDKIESYFTKFVRFTTCILVCHKYMLFFSKIYDLHYRVL